MAAQLLLVPAPQLHQHFAVGETLIYHSAATPSDHGCSAVWNTNCLLIWNKTAPLPLLLAMFITSSQLTGNDCLAWYRWPCRSISRQRFNTLDSRSTSSAIPREGACSPKPCVGIGSTMVIIVAAGKQRRAEENRRFPPRCAPILLVRRRYSRQHQTYGPCPAAEYAIQCHWVNAAIGDPPFRMFLHQNGLSTDNSCRFCFIVVTLIAAAARDFNYCDRRLL